jgi:dTDP-4-dehydrorhamnose 3,5-epimerase-like enzyme
MSLINLVSLPSLGDERGGLVALESKGVIPFEIKRVYYIFDTQNVSRGFHAHKALTQVAICLKGSCTMLLDDGASRESVRLDSPLQGILIPHMIWREMHDFSDDCVLLVLASEHYDESDYIRDHDQFIKDVNYGKE